MQQQVLHPDPGEVPGGEGEVPLPQPVVISETAEQQLAGGVLNRFSTSRVKSPLAASRSPGAEQPGRLTSRVGVLHCLGRLELPEIAHKFS